MKTLAHLSALGWLCLLLGSASGQTLAISNPNSCAAGSPSGPCCVSTGATTASCTWTTNVAATSIVHTGDSQDINTHTTESDLGGATSHTVNLTGLIPATTYNWRIQSYKPDHSQNDNCCGDGDLFTTSEPPSSGSLDWAATLRGSHHVTQGYAARLNLTMRTLSTVAGTTSSTFPNVTISGLPPSSTVSFPAVANGTLCCSVSTNAARLYSPSEFEIVIATTNATTLGAYTIGISIASENPVVSHSYTWTLNVDALNPVSTGTPGSYPSIPGLATWQSNMTTLGDLWCLKANTPSPGLWSDNNGPVGNIEGVSWYYDGQRIYYAIGDYTHNSAHWNPCAEQGARDFYLTSGLVGSSPWTAGSGMPTAWRVFPHGLYRDWQRNSNATAKNAVNMLASLTGYANPDDPSGRYVSTIYKREMVYKLDANRLASDLGYDRSAALPRFLDAVLSQNDQDAVDATNANLQPFMDGLQADALIHCYEDASNPTCYHDPRIPRALKSLADWLWLNAWHTDRFAYNVYYYGHDILGSDTRNLNMLIAPLYAWLFQYTGNGTIPGSDGAQCAAGGGVAGAACTYQQAGDAIFYNGALYAPAYGKEFSQNYRWSFDYVTWRSALVSAARSKIGGPVKLTGPVVLR